MNIVIEFLGALFLPENKGLDLEMERMRRDDRIAVRNSSMRAVEEEMNVKRSAEEAAGPSESKEAEVGVVEGGGEVGISSNWWVGQRKRKRKSDSHFNRASKTRRESSVIVAVFGLGNNLMRVHG